MFRFIRKKKKQKRPPLVDNKLAIEEEKPPDPPVSIQGERTLVRHLRIKFYRNK